MSIAVWYLCSGVFVFVVLVLAMIPGLFMKLTLFITLVSKIVFHFSSFYRSCCSLKKIPGWQGHWLYGNLLQRRERGYQNDFSEWAIKNGHKVSKEWVGPVLPCVNLHHPHLLMNHLNLSRDYRLYRASNYWIGKPSAFCTGKSRVEKYKLLTDTFNIDTINNSTQIYTECVDILIVKWKSQKTNIVCVHDDISKLVLDILLRCLYSYQSNCQKETSRYIEAIENVKQVTYEGLSSTYSFNEIFNYFMTRKGWKFRDDCKCLHQMTNKFVTEHQAALKKTAQSTSNMDLLDSLLLHDHCNLASQDIQNEVNSFLFWGLHTTSSGLSQTLYCLAKYPDLQQNCREEVVNSLGLRYLLYYEDVSKFKYVSWFIKETLRHFPPLPELFRILPTDTVIGEYLIPKNTTLCFKVKTIHFNPDCWTDPDEFNPLRFSSDNSEDLHPYAYLPFSLPSKHCVGEDFAMKVMVVVVALILRKFRIQLVKKQQETMEVMLVMQPIGQLVS